MSEISVLTGDTFESKDDVSTIITVSVERKEDKYFTGNVEIFTETASFELDKETYNLLKMSKKGKFCLVWSAKNLPRSLREIISHYCFYGKFYDITFEPNGGELYSSDDGKCRVYTAQLEGYGRIISKVYW